MASHWGMAFAAGVLLLSRAAGASAPLAAGTRVVLNLDGTWEVGQAGLVEPPKDFVRSVPVPGLLDQARPAFADVGRKSAQRDAFWYRRTFRLEAPLPPVALLKVNKAQYGTQVRLNGQCVGEHAPCFTPGYFDLRPFLRGPGQDNELLIRVGAHREVLPQGMPTGWDFEKYRYLPGIYDSVELMLTQAPYLANVQVVPDLAGSAVRVVAEVQAGLQPVEVALAGQVKEARSGRLVGGATAAPTTLAAGERRSVDYRIPLTRCRPWSPEDPFLYELHLSTGGDAVRVRFGMRTFAFNPATGRALLNGKPYFLRGSNFTVYRFFEDAERGDRPWRRDWVRLLHRRVKEMHWNALRYCIGFPPDFWYDIADEEGILLQDEFPIWTLGEDPEHLQPGPLITEYTEWMRDRWNHPSVVIWDAQNESSVAVTGQALRAVRALDLSNRPWDNGWGEPQAPTDCVESHPYRFIRDWYSTNRFRLSEFATMSGVPDLQDAQKKLKLPILINEYAWLWLDRQGNPTCLTDKVYEHLLGPHSTVAARRQLYARLLAAKTEFWRARRQCAGVLHFCALGYSRSGAQPRPEGGATSDHWLDVERLEFEPAFKQYVRDAFNPVGVMLDYWAETATAGSYVPLKVSVINDLERPWKGQVRVQVWRDGKRWSQKIKNCEVEGYGQTEVVVDQTLPLESGLCTLVAELQGPDARGVRSLRDVRLVAR